MPPTRAEPGPGRHRKSALAADRLEATTSGVFDCPGQRVEERQRAAVTLVAIAGATRSAPPPVPGLPVAPPPAPTMPGPEVPAPEPPAAPVALSFGGTYRGWLTEATLCSDGSGTPDRSRQTSWTLVQDLNRVTAETRSPCPPEPAEVEPSGDVAHLRPKTCPRVTTAHGSAVSRLEGGTLYLVQRSLTATTSWVRDEYDAAGNLLRRCRTQASATLGR